MIILLTLSLETAFKGFLGAVGRDHSTYIITWLSHLGFGCGMGDGGAVGCGGVCVITSCCSWHKDTYATLCAGLLVHLHTNMTSGYHIFSWRYHHHDNDENEDGDE